MAGVKTYISAGDFIDLYYKAKQKGLAKILSGLRLSERGRVVSKWNNVISTSDFWVIPMVHSRWNLLCTGDPAMEYEDYVVSKYFPGSQGLRLLSVGCGTGSHERRFAKHSCFKLIDGIDMAAGRIEEARSLAESCNTGIIRYHVGDFTSFRFEPEVYDIILFNSSLHHFRNIDELFSNRVLPLLKPGGFLIINEYVGPDRLQWTAEQLSLSNKLLKDLPDKYKTRAGSTTVKHHCFRPGLLRMLLVDPYEAIDSESILPSVHRHFSIIEEKKLGWDIIHLLLKDISHNFLGNDDETISILSYLFGQEDRYMAETGRSDAVFGIYKKTE